MAFESAVRPFESPVKSAAARFVVSSAAMAEEDAILEWEAMTSAELVQTAMTEGPPQCEGEQEETCRKETEKRIENPDDADQYVMVKVTDRITFRDKIANKSKSYKLNNSDEENEAGCPDSPPDEEGREECSNPVFKYNTWWEGSCTPPCQESVLSYIHGEAYTPQGGQ